MRILPQFGRRPLRVAFLFISLFSLYASAPTVSTDTAQAQGRRYYLRVMNNSRWDIYRIYMSSSEDESWGPDQLGRNVLRSGSVYTITNIVPGEYDVKFVDEDGDACVLRNVAIFKNTNWALTNSILLRCYS